MPPTNEPSGKVASQDAVVPKGAPADTKRPVLSELVDEVLVFSDLETEREKTSDDKSSGKK